MIEPHGGHPDRAFALAQYRRCAPGYDASCRRIDPRRERAVAMLGLQPGETVLDAACGTGPALPGLSARVGPSGRVIGIEQSPEMIAQARARVAACGARNIELIEASVEDAQLRGPLDAVLFSYAHDVLRSPEALANIFRAARPGARVVSMGIKHYPPWLGFLNAWLVRRAWGFLSTTEGLERPWSGLEARCPDLRVRETFFLGSGYIASGSCAATRAPRSPSETA